MKMIELIKVPTSINTFLAEINDIVFNPDYSLEMGINSISNL